MKPNSKIPAADLCLFRFLYCAGLALTVLLCMPSYADMHRDFAFSATPLLQPLTDEPLPLVPFLALGWALVPLLVCAALGVFTRWSLAIAAVLYLVFFAFQLSFTRPLDGPYTYHIKNLGFFILAILAVAPGVDHYTLKNRVAPPREIPGWPKWLIIFGLGCAYFGSGYCKMVTDPLWVDGFTAQANILRQHLKLDIDLSLWIAQSRTLHIFSSVVVIGLELAFIVGIFIPRVRWLFVIGGLGLHLMIYLTMEVNFFPYFCLTYLIMLEWKHLRRFFPEHREKPPAERLRAPAWQVRTAMAAGAVLFLLPVLARVEAWPLSDYRVFTRRNHPERIAVMRFGGEDTSGKFHWLDDRWQHEMSRRHNRDLFPAFGDGDEAKMTAITREVFETLPDETRAQFQTFELFRRYLRPNKRTGSGWVPKQQQLVRLGI